MKRIIFTLLTALIIVGCNGISYAQTKKSSSKKKTTTASTTKSWTQPSSRDQMPSALSGTSWITKDQHNKYVFSGDKITMYSSKPRSNYDDPLIWYNSGPNAFDNPEYILYFYIIEEPEKGVFKMQYRRDPSGKTGMLNLKVQNNQLYRLEKVSGVKSEYKPLIQLK